MANVRPKNGTVPVRKAKAVPEKELKAKEVKVAGPAPTPSRMKAPKADPDIRPGVSPLWPSSPTAPVNPIPVRRGKISPAPISPTILPVSPTKPTRLGPTQPTSPITPRRRRVRRGRPTRLLV